MNIVAEGYRIEELIQYIWQLIHKYHVDSQGNEEMRGFTGEKYLNHLLRSSQRSRECFKKQRNQDKSIAVSLGHDLLEKLIEDLLPHREGIIQKIESFGQEGPIVSQAMQLLDFKVMMPEYVVSNGGILIPETKDMSLNRKKEVKNENYSVLIRGLLGEFESNYFSEGVNPKALLYSIITKMVDQHDNLDYGREFNEEYNEHLYYQMLQNGYEVPKKLEDFIKQRRRKFNYQTTRNGIRIYVSHNKFHEAVLDNEAVHKLDMPSFRHMYKENLAHAKEVVLERGTHKEREAFEKLEKKYVL